MTKAASKYTSLLPNASDIAPGQSDGEIERFVKAGQWLDRDDTGAAQVRVLYNRAGARFVYAGILSRTAPKQEDYDAVDEFQRDRDAWFAACTDLPRELLDAATARAPEKRRREARDEYAEKVGRPVRSYQRNATDEQRRETDKKRQRRYLENMSPEDRKEYERKRKAEQRAKRKARTESETAREDSTARSVTSSDPSSSDS